MPNKKQKNSTPDYESLGKMLVNIYETGYLDQTKSYKQSLLKGVLGGLGSVLGATIGLALLLWVLSLLHNVPFVNRITDNVRRTVQSRPK